MKIDKVIIINLPHRVDRRKEMREELKRVGITNYQFFCAIKPHVREINEWNTKFLDPMPGWFNGNVESYKIGSLGCMKSHLGVLELIKKNTNWKNVLVLEDDTIFTMGNGIKFTQFMDCMKSQTDNLNFALLYLAGNHRGAKLLTNSENIKRVVGTLTTGSYIVNSEYINMIINNIQGFPREIDVLYGNVIQKFAPCYCIFPHLTKQSDGYSDIVCKDVSYKLEI